MKKNETKLKDKQLSPEWLNDLTAYLLKPVTVSDTEPSQKELLARQQAVCEIVEGIRFCFQKGINFWYTVREPDFTVSGSRGCILAYHHPSRNYFRALESLGLDRKTAASMGFACSDKMRSLLSDTKTNWTLLSGQLWKRAAHFMN